MLLKIETSSMNSSREQDTHFMHCGVDHGSVKLRKDDEYCMAKVLTKYTPHVAYNERLPTVKAPWHIVACTHLRLQDTGDLISEAGYPYRDKTRCHVLCLVHAKLTQVPVKDVASFRCHFPCRETLTEEF
jgi:hypothetical protein